MSVAGPEFDERVFRVRRLPNHVKTYAEAADLVSRRLGLSTPTDIHVASLATTLDYWETPPSKIATLQFKVTPSSLGRPVRPGEWEVSLGGDNAGSLIIDTHFLGLTPLNNVDEALHELDVIAISGLGSHPFGSWQRHGSDKSYMWIRDEIPGSIPGARAILYGYDASLTDSDSFQSIRDIARGLFEQLRATGWQRVAAASLAFLAHSLGGIVLMDALLQIADSRNSVDAPILDKVRGAILFGVPTLGMEQSNLQAMTEGQVNETIVQDLSRESNYLRNLNESYLGVSRLRRLRVFWGYETRTSPTVERGASGRWAPTGRHQILVDRQSATRRNIDHDPQSTFPINENHSDLVKFTRGSTDLRTVISHLNAMLVPQLQLPGSLVLNRPISAAPSDAEADVSEPRGCSGLTIRDAINSLNAPELDARITGIEDRFERTLEWVFELQEFTSWLQQGCGIFWISGKPGSGKSTLMKFITQHPKTWDLVHNFQRGAQEISASFFFHFRGSAMQKSFEGVLRSLLKQLLSKLPALFSLLQAVLPEKESEFGLPKWTVSNMELCLSAILDQRTAEIDLCLFFDALDEFDGHHSLICNFLKGLSKSRPASLTRVKVCFSSRPWDIFEANFGECPAFKIQDHTEGDIRDFCLKSLSEITVDVPSIEELVPDIISRAAGVFLWVKLVLGQLANKFAKEEAVTLSDMRESMEALPTELDEFYNFILQRIPHSVRWQTYALLETIIRSNDANSLETLTYFVFRAVLLSDCGTSLQAINKLKSSEILSTSASIATWSGGLAEIVDGNVQLMHQTVHEFATSTKFKERVLGNRAKITHENGHTFFAKSQVAYILEQPKTEWLKVSSWHLRHHMVAAEATTGRSLLAFLSDLPSNKLPRMALALAVPEIAMSWFAIAASVGLRLLIGDMAAKLASALPASKEPLLEYVLMGGSQAKCATAALLLDNGYTLHEKTSDLWLSFWDGSPNDSVRQHAQLERDFALLLMEHGWDMRESVEAPGFTFVKRTGLETDGASTCSILHIAYPELTRCLLERGFDPNTLDSRGNTPLDYILRNPRRYLASITWHLDKARLLAEAGGYPVGCKIPVDWRIALDFLSPEQQGIWLREGWTAQPKPRGPPRRTLFQRFRETLSPGRSERHK